MSNYSTAPQGKDPELWQTAKKRASFKRHFATYIIVNIFLWAIWFFTDRDVDGNRIPWPAWTTLGWGVGLAFHYIGVYISPQNNSVDREYQKLVDQQNKQ